MRCCSTVLGDTKRRLAISSLVVPQDARRAPLLSARLNQLVAIDAICGESGLARCGGRLRFLDSLVGDSMGLRGAAQLGELVSHYCRFGDGSQYADSGFASFQLAAEPHGSDSFRPRFLW